MGMQFTFPEEMHSERQTIVDAILVYSCDRTTFFQTITSEVFFSGNGRDIPIAFTTVCV